MTQNPQDLLNKSAEYYNKIVMPASTRVLVLKYVGESTYLVGSIEKDAEPSFYVAHRNDLTIEKNEDQPEYAEEIAHSLLDLYTRQGS